MITFFTPQHNLHAPEYEFFRGERVACFESPARADFVRAEVIERGHEIREPNVDSSAVLRQVHSARYLAFLETAWAQWVAVDAGNAARQPFPSVWPVRTLRSDAKTSHIPILMLTARGEFTDKIIGLGLGADDYVVKPFDARELVARIYTVLRRSNAEQQARHPQANKEIVFNRRRLDCQSRQLTTTGNQIIPLSNAEFRLLMAFIERPERVLSREQLLDAARGRSIEAFDRSIDVQVSRLRRKLESDTKRPAMIRTVRNGGYLFTPSVTRR